MKGRPVALQWLRLENVRGFASLDLDLSSRRRTVLIGQNGTGKTTLLRAVALAMAGSDALLSLAGTPLTGSDGAPARHGSPPGSFRWTGTPVTSLSSSRVATRRATS